MFYILKNKPFFIIRGEAFKGEITVVQGHHIKEYRHLKTSKIFLNSIYKENGHVK